MFLGSLNLDLIRGDNKTLNKKFGGKTAAAVIVFPTNKILLIKRGTIVFRGFWALPGGKVDAGETVKEAVVREVREETGLKVKIVRKIWEYHEIGIDNVNIMDQYRPEGRAGQYKKLGRCTTSKEFSNAIQLAKKLGLNKLNNCQ